MAYNGSTGLFSRIYSWVADRDAGVKIRADRMDAEDDGFATGLSTAVCKDGQTTATANLPMGGFKHTNVADGTGATHYAALGQAQAEAFIWCGTAGGTKNALTLTPTPAITAYAAGQRFRFKAGVTQSDNAVTIAISGLATKAGQMNGAAMSATIYMEASKYYEAYYTADGAFEVSKLGVFASIFAQTLMDDASASAARMTLGLGTASTASTATDTSGGLIGVVWGGTPTTDHTSVGPTTNTFAAAGSITVMDLVYLDGSSQWAQTDADAAATSTGALAISLESKTVGQAMSVALPGSYVRDDTWAWTPGDKLYISETAGAISASVPTGVDGIVRVIGYAVTADVIWFEPSKDYVTIDASGTIKNVTGIAPAAVSSGFTLGTPQATTSGTAYDFTIPSGTKIIKINFQGVSFNGAAKWLIQLGDADGIENTVYVGVGEYTVNAGIALDIASFTDGFGLTGASNLAATDIMSGTITLTLQNASTFTWCAEGSLGGVANLNRAATNGYKSLSQELTTVRITTQAGTATGDAGALNVAYL